MHRATELLASEPWPANLARPSLVLVDDAQELTPGATRLLTQLVGNGTGLILFGDPDASTLGFRASNSKAMTELVHSIRAERKNQAAEPALYLTPRVEGRSQSLVHVLAKLAEKIAPDFAGRHRFGPVQTVAELMQKPDTKVPNLETASFATDAAEAAWLANRLRELHLQQGVSWNEIAVVARTRRQLEQLELVLANHGVPARIQGAQAALRDEFGARSLLLVARATLQPEPIRLDEMLELLQSPFVDLNVLELRRLRRFLRAKQGEDELPKNSDDLLLELFRQPAAFAELRGYELNKLRRFTDRFHAIRTQNSKAPIGIEELLWQIFGESAPSRDWLEASRNNDAVAAQANRNLDSISALFAAAKRFAERNPAAPASEYVERQLAVGLPEDTIVKDARAIDRVQLLTPAGLIGQQFRVVAAAKLIEGIWPNLRARSSLLGAQALEALVRQPGEAPADTNELPNELRMFYKTVGAATETFIATVTQTENDVASQFFQLALGGLPRSEEYPTNQLSLRAMTGSLRRALVSDEATEPFHDPQQNVLALAQLAIAKVPGADPSQWLGILEPSTEEPLYYLGDTDSELVPVSPSTLEDFMLCPLHWFIKVNGGDDRGFEANFGTILHKALEKSTTGSEPELRKLVEAMWPSLRFDSEWQNRAAKRRAMNMVRNLATYLADFGASGGSVLGAELGFSFVHGDAQVSGRIDRVEQSTSGKLMVVDLKTIKKAPNAKELEENPQLLTYQLAVARTTDENDDSKLATTLNGNVDLDGARLVIVGTDNLQTPTQLPFDAATDSRAFIEHAIQTSAEGMAGSTFVARVGEHCLASQFNLPCEIHIIQAVSHVG
jgi:superfamily I DNA/RNA helicase/RecB family exonuclease